MAANVVPPHPLYDTLGRIGTELDDAAVVAERVQTIVSVLIESIGADCMDTITELQQLDRLTQTLSALSSFVDNLALRVPEDLLIDSAGAAERLPLASLAARLIPSEPQNAEPVDAGDCAFF